MKNDHAADLAYERYLIEVDGLLTAEYRIFVKALKASLQLKHEFPNCSVKLREADERSVQNSCSRQLAASSKWIEWTSRFRARRRG